jgi:WD repeat-containing protein 23
VTTGDDEEAGPRKLYVMPIPVSDMSLTYITAVQRTVHLSRAQIMALLRGHGLRHALFHTSDDDDERIPTARRRRPPPDPNRFPKVPSAAGRELMESGLFGSVDRSFTGRKQLARRMLDRELGLGDRFSRRTNQDLMAQV